MMRSVQAVYERGILRPVEPLALNERQVVQVLILDDTTEEPGLDFAFPGQFEPLADHTISSEAVRTALAPISGSIDRDFGHERDER